MLWTRVHYIVMYCCYEIYKVSQTDLAIPGSPLGHWSPLGPRSPVSPFCPTIILYNIQQNECWQVYIIKEYGGRV